MGAMMLLGSSMPLVGLTSGRHHPHLCPAGVALSAAEAISQRYATPAALLCTARQAGRAGLAAQLATLRCSRGGGTVISEAAASILLQQLFPGQQEPQPLRQQQQQQHHQVEVLEISDSD